MKNTEYPFRSGHEHLSISEQKIADRRKREMDISRDVIKRRQEDADSNDDEYPDDVSNA